jgi:hypothetical protein
VTDFTLGVGASSSLHLTPLREDIKALKSRYKLIKSGTEDSEILKIAEESRKILNQIESSYALATSDQMEKLKSMHLAVTKLYQSSDGLKARERELHVELVATQERLRQEPYDEKRRDALIQLETRLSELMTKGESAGSATLTRHLQKDQTLLAQLTKEFEAQRHQHTVRSELRQAGIVPGYKPRIGYEAFRQGEGGTVVSGVRAGDVSLVTRDPKFGPQARTKETLYCQEIVQALLRGSENVTVTEKSTGGEPELYVAFQHTVIGQDGEEKKEDIEMKLDDLMKEANFAQIRLTDEEFKRYEQCVSEGSVVFGSDASEQKFLAQLDDPNHKPPLTPEEKEALLRLSLGEKRAIHGYTDDINYCMVNLLLRSMSGRVRPSVDERFPPRAADIQARRIKLQEERQGLSAKERAVGHTQRKVRHLESEVRELKSQRKDLESKRAGSPEAETAAIEASLKANSELIQEKRLKIQKAKQEVVAAQEEITKARASLDAREKSLDARESKLKRQQEKVRTEGTAGIIKEAFLHAAAVNTALEKIPDHDFSQRPDGKDTYLFRCDLRLPEHLLEERKQAAKKKGVLFERGVTSTSVVPAAAYLASGPKVLTVFKNVTGKVIFPLSDYPDENEALMPPSLYQYLGYEEQQTPQGPVTVFYVQPVGSPIEDSLGSERPIIPTDIPKL